MIGLIIFVVVVILVGAPSFWLLLREPGKKVRRKELIEARETIGKLGDIVSRYGYSPDPGTDALVSELRDEIQNYWRGIKV